MQRIPPLAEFLLIWDVNPKAIIVERPRGRFSLDSARDHMFISEACDEFEYVFRDLASPQRANDILEMKAKVRKLAEEVGITKPTAGGALKDETKTGKKGRNSEKNKKKSRTAEANSKTEVENAGVEFSRIVIDPSLSEENDGVRRKTTDPKRL